MIREAKAAAATVNGECLLPYATGFPGRWIKCNDPQVRRSALFETFAGEVSGKVLSLCPDFFGRAVVLRPRFCVFFGVKP